MLIFDDAEKAYLRWLHANPGGYVINASKGGDNDLYHAILHRATCRFISSDKQKNYTTTTYMKVCALDKQQLVDWGHQHSSKYRECLSCKP